MTERRPAAAVNRSSVGLRCSKRLREAAAGVEILLRMLRLLRVRSFRAVLFSAAGLFPAVVHRALIPL